MNRHPAAKAYLMPLVFGLLLAGSGCSPTATSAPTPGVALTGFPYPGPTLADNTPNIAYPVSTATRPGTVAAIPFRLEKPVYEGATQVFGRGPATVPIVLQDVTFAGVVLSATTIDSNGTFAFAVAPLEKNHRIGVTLGDLSGTPWQLDVFLNGAYDGDEPVFVPQVGQYFDTVLVESRP
jgi:hypothetical protein